MSGTPADRNKLRSGLFNLLSLINWKDCAVSPCEDKERLARIERSCRPSVLGGAEPVTAPRRDRPLTEAPSKTEAWDSEVGVRLWVVPCEVKAAVVLCSAVSSSAVACGPSPEHEPGIVGAL